MLVVLDVVVVIVVRLFAIAFVTHAAQVVRVGLAKVEAARACEAPGTDGILVAPRFRV
jgi:hypothetical protein